MKILWTRCALRQFEQAQAYIAERSPQASPGIAHAVRNLLAMLDRYPMLGREGRVDGTREFVITGMPYLIAYQVSKKDIRILAFLHGAQRWLEEF